MYTHSFRHISTTTVTRMGRAEKCCLALAADGAQRRRRRRRWQPIIHRRIVCISYTIYLGIDSFSSKRTRVILLRPLRVFVFFFFGFDVRVVCVSSNATWVERVGGGGGGFCAKCSFIYMYIYIYSRLH